MILIPLLKMTLIHPMNPEKFLQEKLDKHCPHIPIDHRWYSKHEERAELELGLLEEKTDMKIDQVNGNFVFSEVLKNKYGHDFFIVMIPHYKNFPFVEAKIFCVNPIPEFEYKYHVLHDGSLCLAHSFPSKTSLLIYRSRALLWCSSYESYQLYGEHLA